MASDAPEIINSEPVAVPEADREAAQLLGIALRVLRARSGLNQSAAGEQLGISAQAWGQYELGRSPAIFRPSVQRKLAEALGFSVHDLTEELGRASDRSAA